MYYVVISDTIYGDNLSGFGVRSMLFRLEAVRGRLRFSIGNGSGGGSRAVPCGRVLIAGVTAAFCRRNECV